MQASLGATLSHSCSWYHFAMKRQHEAAQPREEGRPTHEANCAASLNGSLVSSGSHVLSEQSCKPHLPCTGTAAQCAELSSHRLQTSCRHPDVSHLSVTSAFSNLSETGLHV